MFSFAHEKWKFWRYYILPDNNMVSFLSVYLLCPGFDIPSLSNWRLMQSYKLHSPSDLFFPFKPQSKYWRNPFPLLRLTHIWEECIPQSLSDFTGKRLGHIFREVFILNGILYANGHIYSTPRSLLGDSRHLGLLHSFELKTWTMINTVGVHAWSHRRGSGWKLKMSSQQGDKRGVMFTEIVAIL